MVTTCPSCNAALDTEATVLENDAVSGSNSIRCRSCGYVMPLLNQSVIVRQEASRESVAIGNVDTDVSQSGNKRPLDDMTLIPDSPSGSRRVGHFELIRVLGQGAFGAVWLAKDLNLGRRVALKLPTQSETDSSLLHEAQTAARLAHPNIVSVFEVGEVAGQLFIASEFVDGRTLRDELREKRPASARAVEVMAIVARAAHYAHLNNVVHRDMKPANVMVDRAGVPYITDFGIAKSIVDEETISLDGEVVGTIAYMAPEQASGRSDQADARADVYSMGVMLFELLTEGRPFQGNAHGIIFQKTTVDAPSPRTLVPALSRDLETICLKCLERDPDKRYQTALELADELERFQQNIPILARPVSALEKAWRWCCRNPAVSGTLTFTFAALMAGLLIVSHFWNQAVGSEQRTRSTLYRAHMNLAVDRLYAGQVLAARDLLDRYETDIPNRSFIQPHLQRLSELFLIVVDHGARVVDVSVSFDGTYFATASASEVRVWSSADGRPVRAYQAASWQFREIEFAPRDHRLLTACSDGVARLWNPTAHGRVVLELRHGSELSCAAFFRGKGRVLTAGPHGTVKVWQVNDGTLITDELSVPGQPVFKTAFSQDGSLLGILSAKGINPRDRSRRRLRIVDTENHQQICESADIPFANSMAFEADERSIVVTAQGGKLLRLNVETGKPEKVFLNNQQPFGSIASIADSGRFAVTSINQITSIFNDQLQIVRQLHTHNKSFGVVDSSADGRLLVVGSGDGTARLIDATRATKANTVWTGGPVRGLAFTKDSRAILMACDDGTVRRWSPESGDDTTVMWQDDRNRVMRSIAVSPVSGKIAACGMMKAFRIADSLTGKVLSQTELPFGGYSAVAFSTDGSLVSVGSRAGAVLTFDSADCSQPMAEFLRPEGVVNALSFVNDADVLAVAWNDGRISLINARTGNPISELPSTQSSPLSLACHPDSHLLVAGTQTGELHFYSLKDNTQKARIRAHSGLVSGLAVFPDGTELVSSGLDGALNIWHVETRELVGSLPGHNEHRTFAIAVSPDGNTVASSGLEGDVRIWRSVSAR